MANLNRKRGHRSAVEPKKILISFCFSKIDKTQGQTIEEWEQLGLLSTFIVKSQQISNMEYQQALAQQLIKQYTKVGFPENSEFIEPKHVTPTYWAVIHITQNSKEVVVGYLDENNVFYIIFLDKEHKFWPTDIQSRGKNKR
ncbi:hypothetical protein B0A58_01000 [Flavobacterium branchiophilum NBRC 15030 = ATCC 35035]|uniref:Uncharacterized protein n=1 Tax=Flavobacterium branchiophilum TaxID=55197 RepID=A0A543G878_9FLAO|nr:hypothetical protein [Flavobacterium branchiophilum]OXA81935.1 hypothetical protein B0A58_01000 [Flavobacterium branchiophilum NBRC 15030 = ATCC 35035]TQM42287.1 hypothetical protein BC670_3335 [Flavobacterium branchiophilum]GEM54714.1 hypothetical protein FB1_09350 [Flavobacterium branchiophilum NBRC 15030 = ATCC 35035]